MGLPVSKLFLFLAVSAGIGAAPAWSAGGAGCADTGSKFIKTVDEQLRSFGVENPSDPCPEQDRYDNSAHNCSANVKELRDIDQRLRNIMKEKCENAADISKEASSAPYDQNATIDYSSAVYKRGADINRRELATLKELAKQVEEMRVFYAKLAQGAKEIQSKVTDKAAADPNGKDEHTDRLRDAGQHRGSAPTNNQEAKNFFKDGLGRVTSAVSNALEGKLSKQEVDQIQTPLTKEPLRISAAANDWKKQIEARQKVVESQGSLYTDNKNSTSRSSDKMAQANSGSTGGQSTGAGNGAGSGSDSASGGNMGQAMQAASGLAGAAGGGSGSGSSSGGGSGNYGSYADNSGSNASYGSTAGASGGSAGTNSYSSKTGQSTGSGDGSNKIANLDNIVKGEGKNGDVVTTGASASPGKGSSLRDAMRERLGQYSSGGGSGGSSGATEGSGGGGTGANASSGAVPTDLLPATASVASDNPLEASSGSVGGDLGNTDFSLAGSDTDAAVKGMLKDFGVGESGREPASEAEHQAPEILASDSPSLFMRTRETHLRSLKKGLVINGLRAKL